MEQDVSSKLSPSSLSDSQNLARLLLLWGAEATMSRIESKVAKGRYQVTK